MAANSEPNETESSGRPPRLIRIEVGSDLIAAPSQVWSLDGAGQQRSSGHHLGGAAAGQGYSCREI
jgi:hypothetical protein